MHVQDPPEYFDPPGGLLTFDLQLGDLVNKSVPTNGGETLEDYRGHFELVNAQLQQVGRCNIPSHNAMSRHSSLIVLQGYMRACRSRGWVLRGSMDLCFTLDLQSFSSKMGIR